VRIKFILVFSLIGNQYLNSAELEDNISDREAKIMLCRELLKQKNDLIAEKKRLEQQIESTREQQALILQAKEEAKIEKREPCLTRSFSKKFGLPGTPKVSVPIFPSKVTRQVRSPSVVIRITSFVSSASTTTIMSIGGEDPS
jgi:hypothetical protein